MSGSKTRSDGLDFGKERCVCYCLSFILIYQTLIFAVKRSNQRVFFKIIPQQDDTIVHNKFSSFFSPKPVKRKDKQIKPQKPNPKLKQSVLFLFLDVAL